MDGEIIRATWLINRLIADPRGFDILCSVLGDRGPTPFDLQQAFYFFLESIYFNHGVKEYAEFEEISFVLEPEEGRCSLMTSSGFASEIYALDEENSESKRFVSSKKELEVSAVISYSLMSAIRELLPEKYKYDFMLVDLPNKDNNFLIDSETKKANGKIKLVSTEEEINFEAQLIEADKEEEDKWEVELERTVWDTP